MRSVPGSTTLVPVEHPHLARSLQFPPDMQLFLFQCDSVSLDRNRVLPTGETERSAAGTFTVKALMFDVEEMESRGLNVELPLIRAELEGGITKAYGVPSISVSVPGAAESVTVLTRSDGERWYIVDGDFGPLSRKADWLESMDRAWEALAIVQSVPRARRGRPSNSGRYPDKSALVSELERFVSEHHTLPSTKEAFIQGTGTSRDTLDAALRRMDLTWEQVLGEVVDTE